MQTGISLHVLATIGWALAIAQVCISGNLIYMDAILREVRTFVQANNTTASTYKNEIALLTAKAKQLDGEIN